MTTQQNIQIPINFTPQELDTVVFALRKMPYENVAELLINLDKQFREFRDSQQTAE